MLSESFAKYASGVARIGSSSLSLQHGVSSFARSSWFPCAIAATLVVASVMLAALAFLYSATAGPVGGSCLQPVGAATLVALLAALFVIVLQVGWPKEPSSGQQ